MLNMTSEESIKISMITVVYNDVQNIEETINSVINQTYDNIEYIVIDGGSTDGTVDVIKRYENNINYWVSEPDKGIYDAMNKGILKSTGEYINFLNSGDTFYSSNVVLEIVDSLIKLDVDLIYGKAVAIYPTYKVTINGCLSSLKNDSWVCHQTIFVKTEIQKRNLYDINYKSLADVDFCSKVLSQNIISYKLDEFIVNYKAGGFSSDKSISYSEKYLILKKYYGKYYAYKFYFRKILLEQNTKKVLQKLGLHGILTILTEINNKTQIK
jgi:glycosyltransferase involved in cell wall biosynthesis